MAGQRKAPGEARRRKKAQLRKKKKQSFTRPREWAEHELIGVKDWIKRLEGPESDRYPTVWRDGQLRHYKNRANQLRAEIKAHGINKSV